MTYLLDSNVCIEFLRNQSSLVAQRVTAKPTAELRSCAVVRAELVFGANASANPARNLQKVLGFLAPLLSIPFDDAAADVYGRIRADLEAKGTPIGPNDFLIAAIALANQFTLVTNNTSEFSRVSGLTIEDWSVP